MDRTTTDRAALSNTSSWKLRYGDQDIRGYTVLDAAGEKVGVIDAMLVNTAAKRVDTLVLEDGREVGASKVTIGDDYVYLNDDGPGTVEPGSVTVYDDYGHVVEQEKVAVADYDNVAAEFQEHYGTTYGHTDNDFAYYEPAYRYGYERAFDDPYRDRHFADAEVDLRTEYTSRYPDRDYAEVRDAVSYGYQRAQYNR